MNLSEQWNDDNSDKADMQNKKEIFTIQTNYDQKWNIKFDPGWKGF